MGSWSLGPSANIFSLFYVSKHHARFAAFWLVLASLCYTKEEEESNKEKWP